MAETDADGVGDTLGVAVGLGVAVAADSDASKAGASPA